jgi:hypothetical protein
MNLRNLQIYFPKENSVVRVYGKVDRVHDAGSRGLRILIKQWSSIVRWEAEINLGEGLFHVLISIVDWATDSPRQLRLATVAAQRVEWWHHGLLLWWDGPTATVSFSRWGLHLRG